MKKNRIMMFWFAMDAFYIIRFVYLNIQTNRIPIYDDVISFLQLSNQHGFEAWLMLLSSLFLVCSILYTAILFFNKRKAVFYWALVQTPFRILLTIPSLSFLPWLYKELPMNSTIVFFCVIIISEIIKLFTLYRFRK